MSSVGNNKKSTMEKIKNYLIEVAENEKRCYERFYLLLDE